MSSDTSNASLIVSIIAVAGSALGGFITLWIKLTDRIKDADSKAAAADAKAAAAGLKAEDALQDAAEAKNEIADLRADFEDRMDRRTRDYGEAVAAIKEQVTQLAFFVRDGYVRKPDFDLTMKDMKDSHSTDMKEIKSSLSNLTGMMNDFLIQNAKRPSQR